MKPIIHLLLAVALVSLLGCAGLEDSKLNLRDALIEKLIQSQEAQATQINGKVIILKTGYCETSDCDTIFEPFADQIQLYTREDAFMRAIKNSFEIIQIDEEERRMILRVNSREGVKKLDVRL